ncbi:MAG: AAA family ATPase [Fibrobacteria bacterium]|nr:AAA family ATPase [Fibrobacteria bacterium]
MAKTIAVAGKGGTGKTTLVSLIVDYLVQKKQGPILAIDADPDSNLGTLLGFKKVKTVGELRDEVLKEMKDFPAGMTKASYMEAGLHEIIEEADGFDLLTMGRGEGPGCYCYLNNLIRKFSEDLTPSYKWVVIDNEAGLEHINRRTSSNVDILMVVVNNNPISINTARSVDQITKSLKNKIYKKYLVTNQIKEGRKEVIQQLAEETGMEYVCDIPSDDILEETIFNGGSLRGLDSPAKEGIFSLMEKIGG